MHHQQVAAVGVHNEMRKGQRCKIIDALLTYLLTCPGDDVALFETFDDRIYDDLSVDIALDDRTVQFLQYFKHLTRTRTIQAEISSDHDLVDGRLARQIAQDSLQCYLVPMNVGYDRNAHRLIPTMNI